jgi:hypothetical protein
MIERSEVSWVRVEDAAVRNHPRQQRRLKPGWPSSLESLVQTNTTMKTKTVFLFDVDNTLLDNDRVTADLRDHLECEVGHERQERYWSVFEELRSDALRLTKNYSRMARLVFQFDKTNFDRKTHKAWDVVNV